MKNALTDKELAKAAGLVRESMIASLPELESETHDFSPAFQKRMLKLLNASRRRKKVIQYTQRVAAVFVAAVLSASLWLTIDVSAREVFFEWVREKYEDSFIYHYFNLPEEGNLPDYSPTWLPSGYSISHTDEGFTATVTTFTNGEDEIYLRCRTLSGESADQLFTTAIPEPVLINGNNGDYYEGALPDDSNALIWIDESSGVVFGLAGFPEKETLLKIAESVAEPH